MPHGAFGTHADGGTEAFGRATYRATKQTLYWVSEKATFGVSERLWTVPLGPSVGLPMGPRSAVLGG
eukprot:4947990-Pyramimonas_sp.AAC.1